MKILALDFGGKRIGLAIARDEVVVSLDTVSYHDIDDALGQLLEIIHREEIEKIVLGLPMGNETSEDQVRAFAHKLNQSSELPIEYTDELLTSAEAERLLRDNKLDPRSEKYKEEVDRLAARLILEQYLNSLKN